MLGYDAFDTIVDIEQLAGLEPSSLAVILNHHQGLTVAEGQVVFVQELWKV